MVKYYIINRQVLYNTWASNIMLCAKQCKHSIWGIPLYISTFTGAYSWVVKNPTCLLAIGWGPIWYASQLIYLILLSGQASVEINSEFFQLTGICLLQLLFTCLKLRTHSRYYCFAKRVGKITRARSFLKTLKRSTYLLRLYSSCLSLRSKAKVYFINMAWKTV